MANSNMNPLPDEQTLEEDELLDKVPTKYRDMYDSDDFEKFTYKNREWD